MLVSHNNEFGHPLDCHIQLAKVMAIIIPRINMAFSSQLGYFFPSVSTLPTRVSVELWSSDKISTP